MMRRLMHGLLKRRSWTSLVQVLVPLMLLCRGTIDATARQRPTTAEPCPVRIPSNHTGVVCACTISSISEIGCSGGLDAVPEFLPNGRVFHALYLAKQNISALNTGSFTNLQVSQLYNILILKQA